MASRFLAAIFSTAIFTMFFIIISYTPVSHRQPDTWYEPFGSGWQVFAVIFGLAYVLGAIPASWAIDRMTNRSVYKVLLYFSAGFIGTAVIFAIISLSWQGPFVGMKTFINFALLGALGAWVYYAVLNLFRTIMRMGKKGVQLSESDDAS